MTDEEKALVECVRLHRHWKNSCGDLDNAPFLLCNRIEQLTAEVERLNEALRECVMEAADWARQAGEAKGKLEGSEMPGIVDSWKAECERLREVVAFYADWGIVGPHYDDQVHLDSGDLARAALEAKQ